MYLSNLGHHKMLCFKISKFSIPVEDQIVENGNGK
jgi:hypothetical protein